MEKTVQSIIVIVFALLFCGCLGINTTRKLEKKTKAVFTNRLEGQNTGLDAKLDLNGYFRAMRTRRADGSPYPPGDTLILDLILYDEGTSHYNFFKPANFETYDSYFTGIIQNGKKDWFYKGLGWGVYHVSGDTIKIQQVSHASNLTARFSYEIWFLIENKHTLQLIAIGQLGAVVEASPAEKNSKYNFYPLSVIPPPIPWLKKEKYFWRNPSDWERYMEMIKLHK